MSRKPKIFTVSLRLNEAERDRCDAMADALGVNRSELIRILLYCVEPASLSDTDPDARPTLLLDSKQWRNLGIALNRWGTNYNQGVRSLNVAAKFFARGIMGKETEKILGERIYEAERYFKEAHEGVEDIRASVSDMKRSAHIVY